MILDNSLKCGHELPSCDPTLAANGLCSGVQQTRKPWPIQDDGRARLAVGLDLRASERIVHLCLDKHFGTMSDAVYRFEPKVRAVTANAKLKR